MDSFANDLRFHVVKAALHSIDGFLANVEIFSWLLTVTCIGFLLMINTKEKKDGLQQ